MSGLVSDGQLKGFFHWLGLVHGWPDLEAVRRCKEEGFDDVLMQCGILPRLGHDLADAHEITDPELLEQVLWSTLFNIHSMLPFAQGICGESLDGIILSGRLARREQPVDVARRIYEHCIDSAPVHVLEPYASARGAALVAEDIDRGAKQVLGIEVGDVPRESPDGGRVTRVLETSGQKR